MDAQELIAAKTFGGKEPFVVPVTSPAKESTDPYDPYRQLGDTGVLARLFERMKNVPDLDILELGTRRVAPDPTVRRHLAHPSSRYVASDFMAGLDVDVVADAHKLTETFPEKSFDIVIAFSVFEHVEMPWIATEQIAKVLKPGGWFFAQTHHTFPLHGYPQDFYRFSREALESLCKIAGLKILGSFYAFPATIQADHLPQIGQYPAYLNSNVLAEKP